MSLSGCYCNTTVDVGLLSLRLALIMLKYLLVLGRRSLSSYI